MGFKEFLNEQSLSRVYQHTKDRNIGILTAYRANLTPEENKKRNSELEHEIRKHYGYNKIKGRYVENYGTNDEHPNDEHSFLVIGKKGDDKGELKRFLKKQGEKYDQDSVLHKAHNQEEAYLHGTNDASFPGKNKKINVGKWHPNRTPEFHSVMQGNRTFAFENFVVEELSFINPKSFFSRIETEV